MSKLISAWPCISSVILIKGISTSNCDEACGIQVLEPSATAVARLATSSQGVQKPNTARISLASRSKGLTSLGVVTPATSQLTKKRRKPPTSASWRTKIKTTTSKSGCSKHMTGDASKFLQIKPAKGGNMIFGDNSKGKIIGIGSVGKSENSSIDNVLLVKDSLEILHVEDDEEDTPLYTNPQPQPKETPQVTVENEDQADEEEQEEAQEQEETELPIAWRTHRNHPLDQVIGSINRGVSTHKSRAGASAKSKAKSLAPTTSSKERLYYGDGSYLWFDSEEERTRFLTFFSKRVVAPPRIIPERYPELQGFDDLDAQLLQASLWPFVSRARKGINPALIRAFYSNLRREDDVLYSRVKSMPIELTVEQLGRIAGLPFQGEDVSHYGREDWVLNNEGNILNELGITELIRHASGRPTIHSANHEGRLFVMINMTIAASTDHDHLLPYPFVVMDILERFKVTTTVRPLTKATKLWTISNQTFTKQSNNAATATAEPRRVSTAAGPAEPQAWANLASIADSLNRLHLKVNGMEGYAMNAYFQGINYVPPPLHGTFLGEVYGDEDEEDGSFSQSSSPGEDKFDDAIDGDEMDVNDEEEETEDEK
ncbi:unnamed protein product [Cuscuta campestris]|uniref:Retrovirus-related Pol polyprotein from transposon TNT 1-94-like beta-barrel domain-containing protein n=1 Tax=Cuscuta campestris TaxID=132261 RepID=A0A484LI75_9ASTE|nr:unnamed protein product [Cuscuta campestris]